MNQNQKSRNKKEFLDIIKRTNRREKLFQEYGEKGFDTFTGYLDWDFLELNEIVEEEKFLWTNKSNMFIIMKFLHHLINNNIDIIMAYSSQSILPMLVTGLTKYASGHYLNLRAFKEERWEQNKGPRTPKDLYYSHKLLTNLYIDSDLEYLFQKEKDLYELIRSPSPFDDLLFGNYSPATITWKKFSWWHYIYHCDRIKEEVESPERANRFIEANKIITEADSLFSSLKNRKVSFKRRINDGSHLRAWIEAINAYEDEFI